MMSCLIPGSYIEANMQMTSFKTLAHDNWQTTMTDLDIFQVTYTSKMNGLYPGPDTAIGPGSMKKL